MSHALISKVLLCLLILFSSTSFAQSSKNDCKVRWDDVDKFTKIRQVCTQSQKLYQSVGVTGVLGAFIGTEDIDINKTKVDICGLNVAGINYLQIEFDPSKPIDTHRFKTWQFMLSDDEVITLTSNPINNLNEKSYFFNPNVNFLMPDETIWKKLASTPIKMIRISNDEVNNLWEFEVKSK